MKTLSVTSLLFSEAGNELLVNIGGEQLYLFDLAKQGQSPPVGLKYDSYRGMFSNLDADQIAMSRSNIEEIMSSENQPNQSKQDENKV